jgi:hypothetical protein
MTQDDVIEMAQECNLIGMRPHLDGIYSEALVAFAHLVAAKSMTHKALIRRLQISCLGLDPVDPLRLLVDDVIEALAQQEERNFCPRCGKRTKDIHTCTPPQENT